MSQSTSPLVHAPVPTSEARIESVGINPLDRRRIDVAVDLSPCLDSLTVELVVVGPEGDELCSILLVENREWMIDKIIHLRHDAEDGEYTLHVGIFFENKLVDRAARQFAFQQSDSAQVA